MKILLSIIILLIVASCGSVCSSTNGACTFGSVDSSISASNLNTDKKFRNRSYEATIISDLSPDPILIESIDSELISREANIPHNLPTNLLMYQPDSYKIGVGDRLFIYVYGETERLSASLVSGAAINPIFEKYVRDDGTIFYPNAGIIDVEGSTVEEIRLELTSKLSNVLNNPQVDVSVSEFNSKKVTVSIHLQIQEPINHNCANNLSQIVSNANAFNIDSFKTGDLTSLKFTREVIYMTGYEYLAKNHK